MRFRESDELDPGSKALKWVIAVVVGGIASGLASFFLDRAKNDARDSIASNIAPNAPPTSPAAAASAPRPQLTLPADFLDQLRPGPRPAPGFPPSEPVASFVQPETPPVATDATGLISYWSLDEGSGARAFDSQRKRAAQLYGGRWVTGVRGSALEFNGSTDFLDLGAWPELNFGPKAPFTVACWVKANAKSGKVFWFRGTPDGLPILGAEIVDGKLQAWVRHDGGIFHPHSTKGEMKGFQPLRVGEWHHIALTRDASGTTELFQDGRSVVRTQGQESSGAITTNVRALGVEPHVLRENAKSPETGFLRGCVDEFCVFGRALTADEVARLAGRPQ
jgi:hypothetical protein